MNLATLLRVPAVRQVMLLCGVAAAVAVGFAIVIWSQKPVYTVLYGDVSSAEAAAVSDALRTAGIDFKIDMASGDVLVAETALHDARMQLASQGVPAGATAGMELMQEQSSFGQSQFMENARYQYALQAELARTISTLGAVREARVHLALPKQSTFIRDQKSTSASVMLMLYRGRTLEPEQAAAVVNLVAASVPDLKPADVTVVDQYGTQLSDNGTDTVGAQAATQFKISRQLEATYNRRIEDLLTPLLGAGRVRAEVVADMDFTYTEEARETFDPNATTLRSEYINEDRRTGNGFAAGGVAGALSNQPVQTGGVAAADATAGDTEVLNSSRESTRNFEIDRTVSHTKPQAGVIRRLSVAVLIDETGADGAAEPLSDEELERDTSLVREAVGFEAARGDTVVVLSEAFLPVEAAPEIEPPAIWEKPWLREAGKQLLGALVVLAIAFGVVRPMLRSVIASSAPHPVSGEFLGGGPSYPVAASAGAAPLPMPSFDEKVAAAKNISGNDPARVAQVVRQWVASDD